MRQKAVHSVHATCSAIYVACARQSLEPLFHAESVNENSIATMSAPQWNVDIVVGLVDAFV
jgi:hypothetical protein